MDYLNPKMEANEINAASMLTLALVGDGVYELLTRTKLCAEGHTKVTDMHSCCVDIVNAAAQARAAERIQTALSEEELAVYKRGRNTKVNSIPKSADIWQYHAATGLEALFGWLYLQGRFERINELYAICVEEE